MSRGLTRLSAIILGTLLGFPALSQPQTQPESQLTSVFLGGRWFNGASFEARTVYCVNGRFTFTKPVRVDRSLDLAGTWVVPPFAEAHNHNLGTGVTDRESKAIKKYLSDGVFYVKIQGNLPVSEDEKSRLGLNLPGGPDVAFAQGSLTGTGGHPIGLAESLLHFGYYPGRSPETLKDYRYFTVDSKAELENKWPLILSLRPDFIKTFLWFSGEYDIRKNDPAFFGEKGLDPRLLPSIVEKAHARKLRVSTHVTNSIDFHNAVAAGVDEITHIPFLDPAAIASVDAKLAAEHGITVITTVTGVRSLPRSILPEASLSGLLETQKANLQLLRHNQVQLAIGSDNVADSSVAEFEGLSNLRIFDNLTLLKMWTEVTPRAVFPQRLIGAVREGYEASFIALEGNPLEDLKNVWGIKVRFKQGVLLRSKR